MGSFNRVILMGNVTRDVELRYTQGGTAVTDLGLAINDRVKRDGEWTEETTFVDATLWGRTAEIANEYLSKGSPVLIEGRLRMNSWEQDGQKRSKLTVVADRMQMVGSRQGGAGNTGGPHGMNRGNENRDASSAANASPSNHSIPEDDIPF